MRRFRLIDRNERPIAEGFLSTTGTAVVLALGVQMSPVAYRSVPKMLEDWGKVAVDWLDGSDGETEANQ